jgi:hypothetical protein
LLSKYPSEQVKLGVEISRQEKGSLSSGKAMCGLERLKFSGFMLISLQQTITSKSKSLNLRATARGMQVLLPE